MKIANNKFVSAEYELYVDGANGNGELELMERATSEQPLKFIFGIGMMLPKFEENLLGLGAGDTYEFTIPNEDAYGPYDDDYVVELDRSVFEVDGKFDAEMVREGNVVPLMDTEGNRMNAIVVSVTPDKVTVDLNHPLAGENLHFKGKVLEVRDATEQELAALMGGGGCGGCGCGCDDDECEGGHCGGGCGGCH